MIDDDEPPCSGSSMDLGILTSMIGSKLMGREVDFETTMKYLRGLSKDDKGDVFDFIVAATERPELPTDEELDRLVEHLKHD